MVLFFKYRQCLIILPGVRTRIYAFVYQPLVYAFNAPTTAYTSLHQPLVYKALTNQGGGASVYRPRSLLQYKGQSPPSKRAYDTIRISCP